MVEVELNQIQVEFNTKTTNRDLKRAFSGQNNAFSGRLSYNRTLNDEMVEPKDEGRSNSTMEGRTRPDPGLFKQFEQKRAFLVHFSIR
jgi:hypothetical protein